jgi:hypothetical protein
MEVHAHAHSPRKKFTHYLWEFLMLFLAVFCGFLAENIREHQVEKQRGREYLHSMVEDLKDDDVSFDQAITQLSTSVKMLDSLFVFINDPILRKTQGDAIYYLARLGPRTGIFANNSRTIDQLKNAGGFRLIRNAELSGKITNYYSRFPLLRLIEENFNKEFVEYKHVAARIFDPVILRRQEDNKGVVTRSSDDPQLANIDPQAIRELSYYIIQINGSRRGLISMMESLRKEAEELSRYLENQ